MATAAAVTPPARARVLGPLEPALARPAPTTVDRAIDLVGERLVASADVQPGDVVLALGATDGPVARAASACGALVHTADSPMDGLPFPDDHFDHVLSNFGVVRASRARVAMREIARVTRTGGTVAFTAWGSPRAVRALRSLVRDVEVAEESLRGGAGRYCVFSGRR